MDPKKVFQGLYTGLNIADAYQKGGYQAMTPEVGLSAFFDRRFSDASTLGTTIQGLIRLSRKDFPALANREEVYFYSGPNRLAGYIYRADVSRGVVLYVHGMAGMADDQYAIGQNYFLTHGYSVFAIDLTASGRSEGHGVPGLHQSALDVFSAIKYLQNRPDFENMPLYLFGHSWGGYGVAASLAFRPKVNAVVSLSGFDTPLKEMVSIPSAKIGLPVLLPRDDIEEPLHRRGGEYYDLCASKAILDSGVPTLIFHGEQDTTVPLKGASIFEVAEGSNVEKVLCPSKVHMDIFFTDASNAYANQVLSMANDLSGRYGKAIANVPPAELNAFLKSFDPRMTSVLDDAVFGRIDAFFASHLDNIS